MEPSVFEALRPVSTQSKHSVSACIFWIQNEGTGNDLPQEVLGKIRSDNICKVLRTVPRTE